MSGENKNLQIFLKASPIEILRPITAHFGRFIGMAIPWIVSSQCEALPCIRSLHDFTECYTCL